MTLDRQIEQLLQFLLQHENLTATASQLAAHLHVSTRQIRNYVTAVNAPYPEAPVILSTNKGYVLQEKNYARFLQAEKDCIPVTPQSRQEYILQKLICSSHSVDIFDLSEELYVSISTIESDLKKMRKSLSEESLSIRRAGNLLILDGNEMAKRTLINTLIRNGSYDQFLIQNEIHLLSANYNLNALSSKITAVLSERSLFVTDYNLQTIILHIVIMIDRIRSGHLLQQLPCQDLSSSPAYSATKELRRYIIEEYQIEINDVEFEQLHLIIYNNTTCTLQENGEPAAPPKEYIGEHYIEITKEILSAVSKNYYLNDFEEPFLIQFATHIKNLFLRAQTNYQVKNPFTARIKITCPLIYDMSVFVAQVLHDNYHITINEDEIAFLAFHIGGYFENNLLYQSKLTCLFVYTNYYNSHVKLLERIMTAFGHLILIKNAVSVLNYTPDMHADLVISTVDLPIDAEHAIISPFLREKDMEHLYHKIHALRRQKASELAKRMLATCLHEELFIRLPSLPDKWTALDMLSTKVIDIGYASESFREDILSRELASSTAYPQLAMPHNMQNTVYQNFIFIVILDTPMLWDTNKEIQMILMLGVNQSSRKHFSQIFDYLIEVLSDPDCRQAMLACKTFRSFHETLLELIVQKENKTGR